jgi:hypothetical protein
MIRRPAPPTSARPRSTPRPPEPLGPGTRGAGGADRRDRGSGQQGQALADQGAGERWEGGRDLEEGPAGRGVGVGHDQGLAGVGALAEADVDRDLAQDGGAELGGQDLAAAAADEAGLVTFTPDDIDWEDEVRIAIEERAAFSPDALTGMEASLRFGGPETLESKIFGRLSAWQNWIFQRPNAVGEDGALRRYGTGQKAQFDMTRV